MEGKRRNLSGESIRLEWASRDVSASQIGWKLSVAKI